MVDTGTAITLLTKKWADAHGLTVKEKAAKYISGANGTVVKIIGMTSMTLLLVPTLEIDVANVPFAWATSTKGCSDVICFVGIMRRSAPLLSLCLGWTNKGLLVGHRRRQAVLRSPEWSHSSPPRQ